MIAKRIFSFLLLSTVIFSCSDDLDDQSLTSNAEAHDFVWKAMNSYYLWQNEVPVLSDDKLANGTGYVNFLESFSSPEMLFEQCIYKKNQIDGDRFSRIFTDYNELEQLLAGTNATNGVEYGLNRKASNSQEVYGWVRYILPNSDASTKNIKRGDIFYAVNGTALTLSNYRSLLAQNNYTLNLANFDSGNITPNGQSVSLSKSNYNENPVYLTNVFTHNEKKIGYLMYNSFFGSSENALNQAFANFISQAVTHLIIDLRYNPGGSVATSARLASMINNTFAGQIFVKQQWNQKVYDYYNSQNNLDVFNTRFPTTLSSGQLINSLKLNQVFFLTSKSSASASELLIHNLKPFIAVTQIGDTTAGKNVGSIVMYDSPNYSKSHAKLNANHKYGLLPIVFRSANKDGNGDYASGIAAQIQYTENLAELGVLGQESDPLLRIALAYVRGRSMSNISSGEAFQQISDSKSDLNLPGMIIEKMAF